LWVPARRLMNIGYAIIAAVVIVGGIGFMMPAGMRPGWFRHLPPSPARLIFLAGWLLSVGGIGYALLQLDVRRIARSTGLIASLALFFLFVVAMPQAEQYRYERWFARTVRTNLDGNTAQLAMYRLWAPGLVFYLSMPHPIPLFNTSDQLAGFAESRNGAWVITREKDVASIKVPYQMRASEPQVPWDSPSEGRNRYVLMKLH
jgi:hypothetical protein